HSVPPDRTRLPLRRSAPPSCRPVRPRPRTNLPRRHPLSTPPPAPPRLRRTPAQKLPLPRHRIRPPRRAVLHPRLYRILRPASAAALPGLGAPATPLKRAFDNVDAQLTRWITHANLAA